MGEIGGGRDRVKVAGDGWDDGQPPKRHALQFIQAGLLLCMPNSAQHTPPGPLVAPRGYLLRTATAQSSPEP